MITPSFYTMSTFNTIAALLMEHAAAGHLIGLKGKLGF